MRFYGILRQSQVNIGLYAYELRCLWQLISVKVSLRLYQTVTSFEPFRPSYNQTIFLMIDSFHQKRY